ncbi:MAG: T9SS type A sorting domain-containing protein [Flavobacteriales bacterium]
MRNPTLRSFSAAAVLVTTCACAQFGPAQPILAFTNDAKLFAADLDGDDDLDLVGVFDHHHVKWFENTDGAGTFAPFVSIADLDEDCALTYVADVDGDQDLDLLFAGDQTSGVRVMTNAGDGSFDTSFTLDLEHEPMALAVADINGDGHSDVLVTLDLPDGAGIGTFFGTGSGFGTVLLRGGLHSGPASMSLEIGDVDLVGGLDLILNAANDTLVLARNVLGDGDSWSTAPLDIPGGELSYAYRRPELLDVDNDGDLDIGEARGSAVHWMRNVLDEGGVVSFEENVIEPWFTAGDGAFGRSLCSAGAFLVYVPNNPSLPVRWNSYVDELGSLPYSSDLPSVSRGRRPLLADFNADGRDDLVLVVDNAIVWFENLITSDEVTLTLPTFEPLCLNGDPVELPDATPAGGKWYGQQISNDLLFRSNLPGTMELAAVHAVYPGTGCPLAATATIPLIEGPRILNTVPPVLCSADAPIQMLAEPTNVEWFGLDGGSIIDPAVWNGGFVVCEYNDATGAMCSDLVGPIQRWNSLPAELAPVEPLCDSDAITDITVVAAPPFNVTWEGPVINANNTGAQFDPAIGPGTYTVVLNAEAFGPNQCRNSDTIQVVVGATPEISFAPTAVYCVAGGPIDLTSAEPAGGVWSGTGVSANQLDPTVVGEGTHLLNYFVASPEGCGAQASTSIALAAGASVTSASTDLLLCAGDGPIQFEASPVGGTWNAPVDELGVFSSDGLNPGEYPVTYSYVDPRGCALEHPAVVVTIGAPKDVTIMPVERLCTTTPPFQLEGSASGTWSGALSGEGTSILVDPAALGVGTYTVTLTVTPAEGCPGEASTELVVDVCTGMAAIADRTLTAAPMPFAERTTIEFGPLDVRSIDVFDASGKLVLSHAFGSTTPGRFDVDLAGHADGLYMLHATGATGTARLRLMKAH